MKNWYVVSKFFDNGKIETELYSLDKLPKCYQRKSFWETDLCDIYIDGFDTLNEAKKYREEARFAQYVTLALSRCTPPSRWCHDKEELIPQIMYFEAKERLKKVYRYSSEIKTEYSIGCSLI